MGTPTPLSDFARDVLGDEFCLNCYKEALFLTDPTQANEARAHLVREGVFAIGPGQCRNKARAKNPCKWKGLVMRVRTI